MTHLFLTSSPFGEPGKPLNESNDFVSRLRECLPERPRALMITSDPDDMVLTEGFSDAIRYSMEMSGFVFGDYYILDGRNREQAKELVSASDLIILGGGHVPTQNRFFTEIGLKELMKDFGGTVLGVSAGSMNSADVVYAQPELAGEALDPDYEKFLCGLGFTRIMLLPHFQYTRDRLLDGKRILEDITYPDSMGREFVAIVDGSYLFSDGYTEKICGEAYLVKNGCLKKLGGDGEEYVI